MPRNPLGHLLVGQRPLQRINLQVLGIGWGSIDGKLGMEDNVCVASRHNTLYCKLSDHCLGIFEIFIINPVTL